MVLDASIGREARLQGRVGKVRSPGDSCHSIASAKWGSSPQAGIGRGGGPSRRRLAIVSRTRVPNQPALLNSARLIRRTKLLRLFDAYQCTEEICTYETRRRGAATARAVGRAGSRVAAKRKENNSCPTTARNSASGRRVSAHYPPSARAADGEIGMWRLTTMVASHVCMKNFGGEAKVASPTGIVS